MCVSECDVEAGGEATSLEVLKGAMRMGTGPKPDRASHHHSLTPRGRGRERGRKRGTERASEGKKRGKK